MIYQDALTIPPQTARADPVTATFTIPKGIVNRITLLFPSGCAALAHIQVYHNEFQVWPTTPEKSFVGDGTYIDFEERYVLPEAWNSITVLGWNEDDSYDHTVNVWIGVLPQDEPWGIMSDLGFPSMESRS